MASKVTITVSREPADKAAETRTINFKVDSVWVSVQVPGDLSAYFNEQFGKHTDAQKRRKNTLLRLLELAYKKGMADRP